MVGMRLCQLKDTKGGKKVSPSSSKEKREREREMMRISQTDRANSK